MKTTAIILAAIFVLANPALAQDASPAVTGWADFFDGLWRVIWGYLSNPFVVPFLMAQARALFPFLGNLGVFTLVGDLLAGNWGNAKNVR
jgi:uncharacterized membrane protein HdeD (DUF308 family)